MAVKGEGELFEVIRCNDNAGWLKQRARGIGGSDVAAIMGISKYKSAYALYMEKVGKIKPADLSDNQAVKWGTTLEPIVGEEYKKNHPKREVRRVNAVLRSIKRPWAQASLDYEVKDEKLGWGVLEIKTAGVFSAPDWEDGIPAYYKTQIAHYLSITERPFADVAVLIGGQEYREYRYTRDVIFEEKLNQAVDDFYARYIKGEEVPPITSKESDTASVLKANEPHADDIIEYKDDITPFQALVSARDRRDKATEDYKQAANEIRKIIGDKKGVHTPLGKFTWIRMHAKKFDMKRFTEEHKELKEQYTEETVRDGGIRITLDK